MNNQIQIPLFPADMMQKIKDAHLMMEMEKLRKQLEHEKHVKAGYMGALAKEKLKNETNGKSENTEGDR